MIVVSSSVVLLPKVFPTDLVRLGQLLHNPLAPNIDTYTGGCASLTADDETSTDPEAPYSAIVSTDVRGFFDLGLTSYLGAKLGGKKSNLLSIEAEKLQLHMLKDAGGAFRRICETEEARKWIADMVLHRTACFIVIGLQVIHNAEFKRAVLKEGGGGAYMKLPLEATQAIPLHIKGGLNASGFGHSVGKKVTGVFGIQVQRLDPHIGPSGEVRLKGDASWKWTYQRVKGNQQEDEKKLTITLAEVDLQELELLDQRDKEEEEDDEDE